MQRRTLDNPSSDTPRAVRRDLRLRHSVARVAAVGLSLWLSACASLPDVGTLPTRASTVAAPTVEGGEGDLSARKAHSVLLRRVRGTKNDVAKLAAMEEAATGSPLIYGNKTTLLFDGPQAMV
jgi:cardiolipin synthase